MKLSTNFKDLIIEECFVENVHITIQGTYNVLEDKLSLLEHIDFNGEGHNFNNVQQSVDEALSGVLFYIQDMPEYEDYWDFKVLKSSLGAPEDSEYTFEPEFGTLVIKLSEEFTLNILEDVQKRNGKIYIGSDSGHSLDGARLANKLERYNYRILPYTNYVTGVNFSFTGEYLKRVKDSLDTYYTKCIF